jgi:hypothetical protein
MNNSTQGDTNCAILLNLIPHHMCAALTVSVCTAGRFFTQHKRRKNNVLLFMENSYYAH